MQQPRRTATSLLPRRFRRRWLVYAVIVGIFLYTSVLCLSVYRIGVVVDTARQQQHQHLEEDAPSFRPPPPAAAAPTDDDFFDIVYNLQPPEKRNESSSNNIAFLERQMAQPSPGCYDGRFEQLDAELGVYVGGFQSDYTQVCPFIQFFNLTSRSFLPNRTLPIPDDYAETHQGVAFDETSRWLYIISGQKGGGCSPAIRSAFRIHVDTGRLQALPPLPEARYTMEAQVVPRTLSFLSGDYKQAQQQQHLAHVHAFGGASPSRSLTALSHWRLILPDNVGDDDDLSSLTWQELEPVPDSGSHGISFYHAGYIYHGAGCNLDFGVVDKTDRMGSCRRKNYRKADSHHVAPVGLFFRYVTSFAATKNETTSVTTRQGHYRDCEKNMNMGMKNKTWD